jgi:hypothetical protein
VNTFNRFAMIVILAGLVGSTAVFILLLLLVPAAMAPIFTNIGTRLAAGAGNKLLTDLQIDLTAIGLIVFVPSVVLLLLEFRRTTRDSIRIAGVMGSEAHLSTQAVAQSLIYYVDALPGIVRVKPKLAARNKTVDVRLDVETTPDIDVRAKTAEITQTARGVIEDKLGLKLNRMKIEIHHAAYPRGTAPQPAPAVMPAPPPALPAGTENKNPLSS